MSALAGILPARIRGYLYATVYVVGVLLLAVQAAFLAVGDQPAWLTAALAAYGVLSAPTAALARANLTAGPAPKARNGPS